MEGCAEVRQLPPSVMPTGGATSPLSTQNHRTDQCKGCHREGRANSRAGFAGPRERSVMLPPIFAFFHLLGVYRRMAEPSTRASTAA